jgi:hypothetical protein
VIACNEGCIPWNAQPCDIPIGTRGHCSCGAHHFEDEPRRILHNHPLPRIVTMPENELHELRARAECAEARVRELERENYLQHLRILDLRNRLLTVHTSLQTVFELIGNP